MPKHYEAWQIVAGARGISFPEDLFYELGGISAPQIVRVLNQRFGTTMDPERVGDEKEALAREVLANVQPIPIVVETARRYHGVMPMAVASGGDLPTVTCTLNWLGITDLFDTVVTSDQVDNPKPAPDTFLEAALRMNVPPNLCLVFEDTEPGLEAAKRAGMTGLDIRDWI
jgi:HAD superfamily hydrolase (TIGR01509 family)